MKTRKIFTVMAVAFILTGCASALQTATVIGDIGSKAHDVAGVLLGRESNPNLIIGKELEAYRVGEYMIKVSDGYLKGDPSIVFMAYKDGRQIQSLCLNKNSETDKKIFNDFNQLGNPDKKRQLKDWFMKYANIDLGSVESETPKETTISTPSSLPSIPTPGFTPTPNKPR